MTEDTPEQHEVRLYGNTIEVIRAWDRANSADEVQGIALQAELVLAGARQGELGHRMVAGGNDREPRVVAAAALWVATVQMKKSGKVTQDALARSCGTDRWSMGHQLDNLLWCLSSQELAAYEAGGAQWAGATPPRGGAL